MSLVSCGIIGKSLDGFFTCKTKNCKIHGFKSLFGSWRNPLENLMKAMDLYTQNTADLYKMLHIISGAAVFLKLSTDLSLRSPILQDILFSNSVILYFYPTPPCLAILYYDSHFAAPSSGFYSYYFFNFQIDVLPYPLIHLHL